MLAICSDLDETPDWQAYIQTMKYLNSNDSTLMGLGINLEVGNSIYFDMPKGQLSYWNSSESVRGQIRALIRSGHIDCLHSFGDLAETRMHAGRALDELSKHNCSLRVWVDHASAPSNFGSDIMCGSGDIPESKAYHADLTCGYGIRYVWRGRVTSVVGQGVDRSVRGIFTHRHPIASVITVGKELAKIALACSGHRKYTLHRRNAISADVCLRSGHSVQEFMRCNPYWGGVSLSATANGLAHVLTTRMLSHLVKSNGICILYTHLGKVAHRREPFNAGTRIALERLTRASEERKVLVASTHRVLRYCRMMRRVTVDSTTAGATQFVRVLTHEADLETEGLCIYVPAHSRLVLTVNGREITHYARNEADHTGMHSVSLPWRRLELPRL
jgi:hypothetical protein